MSLFTWPRYVTIELSNAFEMKHFIVGMSVRVMFRDNV